MNKEFKYDAALVHGYWPSQKDSGEYKQGLRGETITDLAARQFWELKDIGILVATNGPVWGEDYKPVGQLMEESWRREWQIPRENIYTNPQALTTDDEVRLFVEAAREHGWTNLLDIAYRRHYWTIPLFYPPDVNVTFKSAEQISEEIGGYEIVKLHILSKYETTFLMYELAQRAMLGLGLRDRMRERATSKRHHKGPGFWPPIDNFDL